MRGGFLDLSCPAGGGPCRAICFREDWLASPVPAPPRNAENPGMGSGGELFFQDCKRIKVFFEAQGLDAISVRGGRSLRFAPWQSEREISSCRFRWTDSGCCVLDVFLSSGGARPARKPAAKKNPRWNVFYRGFFVERPSSGSAPRSGQPRDDGKCIGFGMIY